MTRSQFAYVAYIGGMVIRWRHHKHPELAAEGESRCTIKLEAAGPAVELSIVHSSEHRPDSSRRWLRDGPRSCPI